MRTYQAKKKEEKTFVAGLKSWRTLIKLRVWSAQHPTPFAGYGDCQIDAVISLQVFAFSAAATRNRARLALPAAPQVPKTQVDLPTYLSR